MFVYQNGVGWNSRLPWFPGTFAAETGRKPRKRGGKGAKMRQKHRTSWPQTSVLSRQNLRTLCQRSPYFWNFRPRNSRKQPVSGMWISATDGRLLASEAIFRTVFARFPSILLTKRLDLSCIIIPIHSAKANRKNPNIGFAYTLHRHRCAHTDAKPSGPFVT